MLCTMLGKIAPDANIRAFFWGLTRHKAIRRSGADTYVLRSSEEWMTFTAGMKRDSKLSTTGTLTETVILCDPSNVLSFEEIGRPSIRARRIQPDEEDIDCGIGCGNVRLLPGRKWAGLLGAELKRTRRGFTPERVRYAVCNAHLFEDAS